MKTKQIATLLTFFLLFTTVALAQTQSAPASSGLVDSLTSNLSLKPEQATGAAGAVFAMAKSKLSATDFTKLASGFPEMDTLLKAAPAAAGGVSSALASQGGAAALLGQFNGLGIPAETATKIVPEVLSFVKAKQGDEIFGLLSKAIQ